MRDATYINTRHLIDLNGLQKANMAVLSHIPQPSFFPRISENIWLCERSSHIASAKSLISRLKLCIVKIVDKGLAITVSQIYMVEGSGSLPSNF